MKKENEYSYPVIKKEIVLYLTYCIQIKKRDINFT